MLLDYKCKVIFHDHQILSGQKGTVGTCTHVDQNGRTSTSTGGGSMHLRCRPKECKFPAELTMFYRTSCQRFPLSSQLERAS